MGLREDPLVFVVNHIIWNRLDTRRPRDREEAAIDAGMKKSPSLRKGMVEATSLPGEIAANGVTVDPALSGRRARSSREGYPSRVRQVEELIGADLVTAAEKAIAARK